VRVDRAVQTLDTATGIWGKPRGDTRLAEPMTRLVGEHPRPVPDAADASVELWPTRWAPSLRFLRRVISLLVAAALVALVAGVIALAVIAHISGTAGGALGAVRGGTFAG